MEDGKLFHARLSRDITGLRGGQVKFFPRNLPMSFQKTRFDEKVIRISCQKDDFFKIFLAEYRIGDVGDFLSGGDNGDLIREFL